MKTFVCLQCGGPECCTLHRPDDRKGLPVWCADLDGILKYPRWLEAPERENIYLDPLDREKVNKILILDETH